MLGSDSAKMERHIATACEKLHDCCPMMPAGPHLKEYASRRQLHWAVESAIIIGNHFNRVAVRSCSWPGQEELSHSCSNLRQAAPDYQMNRWQRADFRVHKNR